MPKPERGCWFTRGELSEVSPFNWLHKFLNFPGVIIVVFHQQMNVQRAQYPPVGIGGPGGSPAPPGMQRPAGPGQPYSGGMVRPPSLSQTPGSKRPATSGSSKR